MVLYSYEVLEKKRKELIQYDKEYILDNGNKIGSCRKIIMELYPELINRHADFERFLKSYIIEKRGENLKQLAHIYKHAKNRTSYTYIHWKCGLNQVIPQRASRIISQFLIDETKTKVGKITKPFRFF